MFPFGNIRQKEGKAISGMSGPHASRHGLKHSRDVDILLSWRASRAGIVR